ncbi:hypothetical protein O181_088793 [Austropuccinia psidii MF-1]|uniref:Uncharacterized protein n=1 Tax=Austropuccinia psidii MF-1 TaxID=1389203 RepID=A0A9Q3P3H7_9BASI|nr:hypothetical protein [Austropuccinia psidii MF-1]
MGTTPGVIPDASLPMDLDAVAVAAQPTPYLRRLCLSRGICFDCLQPYTPLHRSGPNRTCPNPKASAKERSTFIHSLSKVYSQPARVSVAAVNEEISVVSDKEVPFEATGDVPLEVSSLSLEEGHSLQLLAIQEAWQLQNPEVALHV